MIVIADTSPLNYLILIGEAEVLHRLYGRVVIPQAVLEELRHPNAPAVVAFWIECRPVWLEVHHAAPVADVSLRGLDLGECEAILLAQQHRPEALLLIDEEKGRREAERRQIRHTGLLGVLSDAATRDLIELSTALRRLAETNFRASPRLLEALLERDARRKRRDASPGSAR